MGNVVKFKHTQVPRQQGEQARIKVVQGPDYGAIYVLTGTRAVLGRGEESDIVISDLKVSRFHAELSLQEKVWMIRDKGSANGIIYNGKSVRQAQLKAYDTITVGETTLEFAPADSGTMMLMAPPRTMEQIQSEFKEIQKNFSQIGLGGILSGSAADSPAWLKDRKTLILVGVLITIFVLYGGGDHSAKTSVKNTAESNSDSDLNLAAYLPQSSNADINKSADAIFKDGLREYFDGNLNRAKSKFETVLQIAPGHFLATLYLENCNKEIQDQVKRHLEFGKKSFDSGKLKEAQGHFLYIMRLLYRDQTNPSYLEAKDQYEKVTFEINERSGG